MKNPLNRRIPRELKSEWSKYIVIFLFMILLISLVSGFLVADNSMISAYNEGFEKYNIEDGHISFNKVPDESFLDYIENEAKLSFYDMTYFNETADDEKRYRVYKKRNDVNIECLMEGDFPSSDNEIAIDRLFAANNNLNVGDTLLIKNKELIISGFVALPDYSCLYENNADMMFDSINFCVGIMTEDGFDAIDSKHIVYNYSYIYDEALDPNDTVLANELSEKLIDILSDAIKDNPKCLVKDYIPEYVNHAIIFTGDDMGKDRAFFIVFAYLVITIIAFVFAVTTSNTITSEAGVIGTLRATGYSREELVRHYMVLPVFVTLLAAIIGNMVGYSVMKQHMADMYYNSYSLPTYVTLWNSEAFVITTVVPVGIMLIINWVMLEKMLHLSPLRFLRRDLSKRGKKKAFRLDTRIPIMTRFRLRIIFQNIPNYITLGIGIVLGSIIIIFGTMFGPLIEDYASLIEEGQIATYQYVLMDQVETSTKGAEKYCLTTFNMKKADYVEDEISVFGIEKDSQYVNLAFDNDSVYISNSFAKKYGLAINDTITLSDSYSDKTYDFIVGNVYTYDTGLAIFMDRSYFNECFDKESDYFTGYFCDVEIKDIVDEDIAATITLQDLTKLSTQMKKSIGGFLVLFEGFGIIMFVLLMFVLSKQIIEKNKQSISMTKILGYNNIEIGGLYIIATSVVVIVSLILAIPISESILRVVFSDLLYKMMPGYIPYIISAKCYYDMVLIGICCYIVVAVLQLLKINRIPKSDALKMVE